MKRVIIKLGVFLLLGAVVNVAVAHSFIVVLPQPDVIGAPHIPDSEQRDWWQRNRPAEIECDAEGLDVAHNTGAVFERLYPYDEAPNAIRGVRIRAGWPLISITGSSWKTNAGVMVSMMLPIAPLWPGFALNTVFYTVIFWLLFAAPGRVRRWRRMRRGLCAKCAYPVGASEVCTECGAVVHAGKRLAAKAFSP